MVGFERTQLGILHKVLIHIFQNKIQFVHIINQWRSHQATLPYHLSQLHAQSNKGVS